jgi:FMN-dependent NADH-azoreductase
MKTLIVQFTPRSGSTTAQLVSHLRAQLQGPVEVIDLATRAPAPLTTAAVDAYVKRHYAGQPLSAEEAQALAVMDGDVEKMLAADLLVTAAPMHNFAMPGPLKTFLDGVIQKGRTWDADASGYHGLMKGKKALALFSSGGVYEAGGGYDHYSPLIKHLFGFMGYDGRVIAAMGTNQDAAAALARARAEIDAWVKTLG